MNASTIEVIDRGMRCLSENLGAAETEVFIATILKERFDYTEWRRIFVDRIDTNEKLDEFIKAHETQGEFKGNPKTVL